MKNYQYVFSSIFLLIIFSSCEIENGPVELLSLVASDSVARSGDTITFLCEAQDKDNDKLSYDWKSSFGTFISFGDSARWIAPSRSGYFHVTCKVSDGVGGSDVASAAVRVVGGVIQGTITNAVNGMPVESVSVSINGNDGITNESGMYNIYLSLQSGIYNVESMVDSFCPFGGSFTLDENFSSNSFTYNFSISPIPEPGEIRIVLNWGPNPRDLDSWLGIPDIDGQTMGKVYYGNRGSSTSVPFATLDTDVTGGYGPETITIKQLFPGIYIYCIHLYSGTGTFRTSDATIKIYDSPDCTGETIQPSNEGEGLYWYVCDIDGETGTITVVNQIQNSSPIEN